MQIKVNHSIWVELGLDDPRNVKIARAYFYLGFGIHVTKRAIDLGIDHPEVVQYLDIATSCGLNFDDYIIDLGN